MREFYSEQDAVRAATDHWMDRSSWPRLVEVVPDEGVERQNRLDEEARQLAADAPQFAVAWGAHIAGRWVVPLSLDGGEAIAAPTRDLAQLLEYWRTDRNAPAGAPCSEAAGLIAAEIDEDGWEYLRAGPAIAAPASGHRPARYHEANYGLIRHIELQPVRAPMRQVSFFVGEGDSETERAAAKYIANRSKPVVRDLYCWAWPDGGGWSFPIGKRVMRGGRLLTAVPLDGAELVTGQTRWRIVWQGVAGRLVPLPEWLGEQFGGKRKRAA